MNQRPVDDDFSGETPIFSWTTDAASPDETYAFDQVYSGQFLYLARDPPRMYHPLTLSQILVYGLTEAIL